MKFKYLFLLIFIPGVCALPQDYLTTVTWETGFPVAKTAEFTNSVSFLGFGFGTRKFLNDRENSVGVFVGWNNFDERISDPINLQLQNISGTISGTQLRAINTFPILVGFHHYFGRGNETRTVIGFSTGVYYIAQRLDIGVYRFQSDNWHFGISPEVGFIIPLGDYNTSLSITGKYHYAFDAGTSVGGKENNFYSWWNLNIGFAVSSLF